MNYTKELDEKLRSLLSLVEEPLESLLPDLANWPEIKIKTVKSLQLRREIIALIDAPQVKGRYRQTTLQELIEKEKMNGKNSKAKN